MISIDDLRRVKAAGRVQNSIPAATPIETSNDHFSYKATAKDSEVILSALAKHYVQNTKNLSYATKAKLASASPAVKSAYAKNPSSIGTSLWANLNETWKRTYWSASEESCTDRYKNYVARHGLHLWVGPFEKGPYTTKNLQEAFHTLMDYDENKDNESYATFLKEVIFSNPRLDNIPVINPLRFAPDEDHTKFSTIYEFLLRTRAMIKDFNPEVIKSTVEDLEEIRQYAVNKLSKPSNNSLRVNDGYSKDKAKKLGKFIKIIQDLQDAVTKDNFVATQGLYNDYTTALRDYKIDIKNNLDEHILSVMRQLITKKNYQKAIDVFNSNLSEFIKQLVLPSSFVNTAFVQVLKKYGTKSGPGNPLFTRFEILSEGRPDYKGFYTILSFSDKGTNNYYDYFNVPFTALTSTVYANEDFLEFGKELKEDSEAKYSTAVYNFMVANKEDFPKVAELLNQKDFNFSAAFDNLLATYLEKEASDYNALWRLYELLMNTYYNLPQNDSLANSFIKLPKVAEKMSSFWSTLWDMIKDLKALKEKGAPTPVYNVFIEDPSNTSAAKEIIALYLENKTKKELSKKREQEEAAIMTQEQLTEGKHSRALGAEIPHAPDDTKMAAFKPLDWNKEAIKKSLETLKASGVDFDNPEECKRWVERILANPVKDEIRIKLIDAFLANSKIGEQSTIEDTIAVIKSIAEDFDLVAKNTDNDPNAKAISLNQNSKYTIEQFTGLIAELSKITSEENPSVKNLSAAIEEASPNWPLGRYNLAVATYSENGQDSSLKNLLAGTDTSASKSTEDRKSFLIMMPDTNNVQLTPAMKKKYVKEMLERGLIPRVTIEDSLTKVNDWDKTITHIPITAQSQKKVTTDVHASPDVHQKLQKQINAKIEDSNVNNDIDKALRALATELVEDNLIDTKEVTQIIYKKKIVFTKEAFQKSLNAIDHIWASINEDITKTLNGIFPDIWADPKKEEEFKKAYEEFKGPNSLDTPVPTLNKKGKPWYTKVSDQDQKNADEAQKHKAREYNNIELQFAYDWNMGRTPRTSKQYKSIQHQIESLHTMLDTYWDADGNKTRAYTDREKLHTDEIEALEKKQNSTAAIGHDISYKEFDKTYQLAIHWGETSKSANGRIGYQFKDHILAHYFPKYESGAKDLQAMEHNIATQYATMLKVSSQKEPVAVVFPIQDYFTLIKITCELFSQINSALEQKKK